MAQLAYLHDTVPSPAALIPVADGVFWLRMPLPFSLDHINLWAIEEDDGWTLVDSGINLPDVRGYWEQLIAGPLSQKPLKRLFVTHLHPDHFGLAGWFKARWGIDTWMTALEFYEGKSLVLSGYDELPPEIPWFFRRAGMDDEGLAELPKLGYGHFADSVYPPPIGFRRIVDGEDIMIGGRQWRVVVGSGHSPEHGCLYCPDLRVLISGDQVLPRISSNISVHVTEPEANPLKDWLESLAKFKFLPEDTRVLPAHGDPFVGLHDRLDALITGHENQLRRLLRAIEQPRTAVDCLPTLFHRELNGFNRLMAIGEALAHLHLLVHRGLARIEEDALGIRRFVKL